MSEWRDRLARARPSNWASWPTLRRLWPWFAALGAIVLMAIPWGIRAEERSLEASSRQTLAEAGILVEDITFNGIVEHLIHTGEDPISHNWFFSFHYRINNSQ